MGANMVYLYKSSLTAFQYFAQPDSYTKVLWSIDLHQGWGSCGPCEHLIWPASEFSLPMLEYNIASKRSSMVSRHF